MKNQYEFLSAVLRWVQALKWNTCKQKTMLSNGQALVAELQKSLCTDCKLFSAIGGTADFFAQQI